MNIKLNRAQILDKIHGCWIGKNIGGTMGGPFEGKRMLLDIPGFTTDKGDPLPNDDLDLQLVWLRALEVIGAKRLTANELADYWLSWIAPHWNEYGITKSNLLMGLLPPLSGEVHNKKWKTSNGAWIRSEIWACLAPGIPNVAVKYAIMDASVDHGLSEGTHAEVFTAVLESFAFFENDIQTLIEKALTYIPADSMIATTVKLVLDCYDKKVPWQETREQIIEHVAEVGWFQAAGNIGFTVLGLMYGEGDMKQSLIYAINCGDDTDCTAGTCGAILGIIQGASGISEDLKEYVGDKIVTMSLNASYRGGQAKTCTELTERVIKLIPEVLGAHGVVMEWTEDASEIDQDAADLILSGYSREVFSRSPFSFEVPNPLHTTTVVEYEKEPIVKAGDTLKIKITLNNLRSDAHYYTVDAYLPEGWTAEYPKTCHISYFQRLHQEAGLATFEMILYVGENVKDINRVPIVINACQHAVPIMIPVVLLG